MDSGAAICQDAQLPQTRYPVGIPHRELPRFRPPHLPSHLAQAFMRSLLKPAPKFGGSDSKCSPESTAHMRLTGKATHGCHCSKAIATALDSKQVLGLLPSTLQNLPMHSHASPRGESASKVVSNATNFSSV